MHMPVLHNASPSQDSHLALGKLAYQQEHSTVLQRASDLSFYREMVDVVPRAVIKEDKGVQQA